MKGSLLQRPIKTLDGIYESVINILNLVKLLPSIEVVDVVIDSSPGLEITVEISSRTMSMIKGAVQISGTSNDLPAFAMISYDKINATYTFSPATSGKQAYRYLLIGE